MEVSSCGGSSGTDTGTDTGTGTGTGTDECIYLCDDNDLAEWECREYTTGFFQCLGGCMINVSSCN
jgi:hypothetical protein